MKKAIMLALVGLAISTWSLEAQATTSFGARSCGAWIANKPVDPSNSSVGRIADNAWLVGFMSGIAAASDKDILGSTDAQSMFLWMDNWCQANPLRDTFDGGLVLFVELAKRAAPPGKGR